MKYHSTQLLAQSSQVPQTTCGTAFTYRSLLCTEIIQDRTVLWNSGLLISSSWSSSLSLTFSKKKQKNSWHLWSVTGGVNTLSYIHTPKHMDSVCYSSTKDFHHSALLCYAEKFWSALLFIMYVFDGFKISFSVMQGIYILMKIGSH